MSSMPLLMSRRESTGTSTHEPHATAYTPSHINSIPHPISSRQRAIYLAPQPCYDINQSAWPPQTGRAMHIGVTVPQRQNSTGWPTIHAMKQLLDQRFQPSEEMVFTREQLVESPWATWPKRQEQRNARPPCINLCAPGARDVQQDGYQRNMATVQPGSAQQGVCGQKAQYVPASPSSARSYVSPKGFIPTPTIYTEANDPDHNQFHRQGNCHHDSFNLHCQGQHGVSSPSPFVNKEYAPIHRTQETLQHHEDFSRRDNSNKWLLSTPLSSILSPQRHTTCHRASDSKQLMLSTPLSSILRSHQSMGSDDSPFWQGRGPR
jgi:hypothetical protein